MKRVFLQGNQLLDGYILLNADEANHIMNALRYQPGQELLVSDQVEKEYLTQIEGWQDQELLLKIKETRILEEEKTELILLQALPKADKMEYIIQKAVELGAVRIVPLQTRRSIVRLEGSRAEKRRDRWQKIASQAAKQSGASSIAQVDQIRSIQEYLEELPADFIHILLWEDEKRQSLRQVLEGIHKEDGKRVKLALIVGPEGGLDPAEVAMLVEAGARPASLGKRILRTETASLAGLSLLQYYFGELG